MENVPVREATEQLNTALRQSEEYRQYHALWESVMANETNRALLREYQRTQTQLQMAAVAGQDAGEEAVQRFQKLSALLYMNPEVAQYLLAQMRLQKLTGEVFQSVTSAVGLELELPGL